MAANALQCSGVIRFSLLSDRRSIQAHCVSWATAWTTSQMGLHLNILLFIYHCFEINTSCKQVKPGNLHGGFCSIKTFFLALTSSVLVRQSCCSLHWNPEVFSLTNKREAKRRRDEPPTAEIAAVHCVCNGVASYEDKLFVTHDFSQRNLRNFDSENQSLQVADSYNETVSIDSQDSL